MKFTAPALRVRTALQAGASAQAALPQDDITLKRGVIGGGTGYTWTAT